MSADEHLQDGQFKSYPYKVLKQTSDGYQEEERSVSGPLYHGGRANLGPGGMLSPGRKTNSWGDEGDKSSHVYFTTEQETAASYARELGKRGRVYEVEPTGEFRQDYNGSDYKSKHPLRVVRKINDWD